MTGSDFLGRWIDLVAYLLAKPPGHDPMREICAELGGRFAATAWGIADFSDERARLEVYRFAGDPARYAPTVGDHPLALHYRETRDPHARTLDDARRFRDDPWALTLLGRLRDDGLRDFVFLPLEPRAATAHRWLGLASDARLGSPARDELERLGMLIRAMDVQHRVVTGLTGPRGPAPAIDVGLSGRELAVLALVARGLTATAIGNTLRISPRTVSKHQQNIYRKLDVRDRLTAVARAQELGMLGRRRPSGEDPVASVEAAVVHRVRQPIG